MTKNTLSYIILITLLLSKMLSSAQSVSEQEAKLAAINWINFAEKVNSVNISDIDFICSSIDSNKVVLNIISFKEKGWVIVSPQKNCYPIVGYSLNGKLDTTAIPLQVKQWLEMQTEAIQSTQTYKSTTQEHFLWDQLINNKIRKEKSTNFVLPLTTTEWGQGVGYNDMCPIDPCELSFCPSNNRAQAGCAAISFAQIMKYWEYPLSGTGSHTYDYEDFTNLFADFENSSYRWEEIKDSSTIADTETHKLIYHAGISIESQYNSRGTGAYTDEIPNAMTSYFNYSPHASYYSEHQFSSTEEWEAFMKNELSIGNPMIYAGYDLNLYNQGHAFICDGYDDMGLFHFKFGWEGNFDGYYHSTTINPGSVNYSSELEIISGLIPHRLILTDDIIDFEDDITTISTGFVEKSTITSTSGEYALKIGRNGSNNISSIASFSFYVPQNGNISLKANSITTILNTISTHKITLIDNESNNILETLYSSTKSSDGWKDISKDISSYSGKIVRLEISQNNLCIPNSSNSDDQYILIDDIKISGEHAHILPNAPTMPSPKIDSSYVDFTSVKLEWNGSDALGSKINYELSFGTDPNNLMVTELSNNYLYLDILDPNQDYFWQVKAISEFGETTGDLWTFTTKGHDPIVKMSEVSEITSTTAKASAIVTNYEDSEVNIDQIGFCISLSETPQIDDISYFSDVLSDSLQMIFKGLTPANTYYISAFAGIDGHISYSDVQTFETLPGPPSVIISQISMVNTTVIDCEITSMNGGEVITQRGVEICDKPNFKSEGVHHIWEREGEWSIAHSYMAIFNDLPHSKMLYARASASNEYGKTYSEVDSFYIVNSVPSIDLDNYNISGASGSDYYSSVTEQMYDGAISDSSIYINDPNGDDIIGAKIIVNKQVLDEWEYLIIDEDKFPELIISGNYSDTLTITSDLGLTTEEWGKILNSIVFFIASDDSNSDVEREVFVSVYDGYSYSQPGICFLNVIPENDPHQATTSPYWLTLPDIGVQSRIDYGKWDDVLDNVDCGYSYDTKWEMCDDINSDSLLIKTIKNSGRTLIIDDSLSNKYVRCVVYATDYSCGGDTSLTVSAVTEWAGVGFTAQTISFDPFPTIKVDQISLILQASASSNFPVSYISSDSNIASVNNDILNINSAGTVLITAYQVGNTAYDSVAVTQTLTIEKYKQELYWDIPDTIVISDEYKSYKITINSGEIPVINNVNPEIIEFSDDKYRTLQTGYANIQISIPSSDYYNQLDTTLATTIIKSKQNIIVETPTDLQYGDNDFNITISKASIEVNTVSLNSDILKITDNKASIVGTGIAELLFTNDGDKYYEALDTTIVIEIFKGDQVITPNINPSYPLSSDTIILAFENSASLDLMYQSIDTSIVHIINQNLYTQNIGNTEIKVSNIGNRYYNPIEIYFHIEITARTNSNKYKVNTFSVYPTVSLSQVSIVPSQTSTFSYQLISQNGQVINSVNHCLSEQIIDVNNVNPGVYFIVIHGAETEVHKIIIQ